MTKAFWTNALVAVASTLTVILLLEGLASLLMSTRAAKRALYMQEESHSRYDPDLGWSHRPGLKIDDLYGGQSRFTTNAQGFRARQDYDKAVAPGRYRIVALGDSFTMGYGVGDEHTYPAQMQALCPAVETVNMGQGGYGLDQDYLWYKRDGTRLDANLLLFAVIAHDFYRMNSADFLGYAKPVLRAGANGLEVHNVPVPETWGLRTPLRRALEFANSLALVRTARWLAQRGAPAPDAFYGKVDGGTLAALELALDDLAALSRARGQHFVIAYLPTSDLLAREPTPEAAWLEAYAGRRHVPFINLVPEFGRMAPWEIAALYRPDYHYTVKGNRLVAGMILRHLGGTIPAFPACPPDEPPRRETAR